MNLGSSVQCKLYKNCSSGSTTAHKCNCLIFYRDAVFSKIFRNFALKLLSVGIGSVIYYIVMQICIWFKIDTDLLKMLSAIVVAIFLAVPYWKAKYFTRVAVKKGGSSNA